MGHLDKSDADDFDRLAAVPVAAALAWCLRGVSSYVACACSLTQA
jgi:hypothetical protein